MDPVGWKRENESARSPVSEQVEDDTSLFFEHSLDLFCVAGFDGYFKRLNPAWKVRLGWALDELLAKPFLDFIHPDDREATQAEVAALSEGTETLRFENRYRHRDGSYRWMRWNARPVPGRQRIYASGRDVTKQKLLERAILEIADREKERLGRELHDGLCQTLAGIAALSSTLSRRLARPDPAASAQATEIAALLNGAINDARDMAHGLGAFDLGEAGVEGALENLALNVHRQFGVEAVFKCDTPFPRLYQDVETHLLRIAQEAVGNSVTHGSAKRIEISLSREVRAGRLCIADDGVGLKGSECEYGGFGLQTMDHRARLIGGSLDIRPRPHGGTAVCCVFPIPESDRSSETPNHAGSEA